MKSMLFGLALLAMLPGCCDWCKKDECEKKPKKEKMMKEKRCKSECEGGNKARKDSMKK